jgi:hypothetical protein
VLGCGRASAEESSGVKHSGCRWATFVRKRKRKWQGGSDDRPRPEPIGCERRSAEARDHDGWGVFGGAWAAFVVVGWPA